MTIDPDGRWRPDDNHGRLRDELLLIRFLVVYVPLFCIVIILLSSLRG